MLAPVLRRLALLFSAKAPQAEGPPEVQMDSGTNRKTASRQPAAKVTYSRATAVPLPLRMPRQTLVAARSTSAATMKPGKTRSSVA